MVSQITENDVVTDVIFISASRLETDSEAYPEMAGKLIMKWQGSRSAELQPLTESQAQS